MIKLPPYRYIKDRSVSTIARGKAGDYMEAAQDALKAHDAARNKAMEERL